MALTQTERTLAAWRFKAGGPLVMPVVRPEEFANEI